MTTDYEDKIIFNKNNIFKDLQKTIDEFDPDIIFGSAISSHIHGEGEYVNIQYFSELIKQTKSKALKVSGGLQATAVPEKLFEKFPGIDLFIRGESENVLLEIANNLSLDNLDYSKIEGLVYKKKEKVFVNKPQKIISDLDDLGFYDYSIFDSKVFLRPYNGQVLKAVDYELSRGCIYACSYCVETVLQKYYGFEEISNAGVIKGSKNYLRNKSADRIFFEIAELNSNYSIKLIRCQDTNFLTINKNVLNELAVLIDNSNMDIMLYIETRPEGINNSTVKLLKKLKVDGVGMGIELSSQNFREEKLNRFANQKSIIKAFQLLKENNIKRTAYNIIGLPEEKESDILNTITFNRVLDPDNITVAFYSPYVGTIQEKKATELKYFSENVNDVDGQLRTLNNLDATEKKLLQFYKKYFVHFVRNGFNDLDKLKISFGI